MQVAISEQRRVNLVVSASFAGARARARLAVLPPVADGARPLFTHNARVACAQRRYDDAVKNAYDQGQAQSQVAVTDKKLSEARERAWEKSCKVKVPYRKVHRPTLNLDFAYEDATTADGTPQIWETQQADPQYIDLMIHPDKIDRILMLRDTKGDAAGMLAKTSSDATRLLRQRLWYYKERWTQLFGAESVGVSSRCPEGVAACC